MQARPGRPSGSWSLGGISELSRSESVSPQSTRTIIILGCGKEMAKSKQEDGKHLRLGSLLTWGFCPEGGQT